MEYFLFEVKLCSRCGRLHTDNHNYCNPCNADYHSYRQVRKNVNLGRHTEQRKVLYNGMLCWICGRKLRGNVSNLPKIEDEYVCTYCQAVIKVLGEEISPESFEALVNWVIEHRNGVVYKADRENFGVADTTRKLFKPLQEKPLIIIRRRGNPEKEKYNESISPSEWIDDQEQAEWDEGKNRWVDQEDYDRRCRENPSILEIVGAKYNAERLAREAAARHAGKTEGSS
jgi:hypothetical protein